MQKYLRRLQDGNICELFYETELNNFDTEKKGEKVYDRVLYMKKIPPGGGNQETIREIKRTFGNTDRPTRVNQTLFREVSHFIDEYEKGSEYALEGTPVEDASFIHPSMVGLLKVRNIHTVEILADVPDSALDGMGMGARDLRDKAVYYIKAQKEKAPIEALAATNREVTRLQSLVEKLMGEKSEPKKRGPKPKQEQEAA
jgi:hypothetical protein